MTEEQLVKIVETLTCHKEDHDLLVVISTNIEQLSRSHKEDRERCVVEISEIKAIAEAAHKRIDGITKIHWMTIGAFGALTIIITLVSFMLKLSGKI